MIYSCSRMRHVQHVQMVLTRFRDNQLYVKAKKWEFHITTMTFLGYVISHQGVAMDLPKVTEWPRPHLVKELQRFLGFANFYWRLIYSLTAAPLTSLLKGKPAKLAWSEKAQAAFEKLKTKFTTALILHHPDPSLSFVKELDASDCGLGVVLSQRHDTPPNTCAFYSKKLSAAERNYDVGNNEILSMKAALEELETLAGRGHAPVSSDHRP